MHLFVGFWICICIFQGQVRSVTALISPKCPPRRCSANSATSLRGKAERGDSNDNNVSMGRLDRYVRIQPKTFRGNRRNFELQTAVARFEKSLDNGETISLDLHAMIHFGDADYFSYFNEEAKFLYDSVLYELVVDQGLLQTDEYGNRHIRPRTDGNNPLAASPMDANTARSYELLCQVDAVDYSQSHWVNADYNREEIMELLNPSASLAIQEQNRPVWEFALASSASPALVFPGSEFLAALFRPSTPSLPLDARVSRRIFSNLFLPGDAMASMIRAVLWMGLPAPEISVMLLDWSSLSPRPTGGISPIALPVLESLFTGNVAEARKLVFSQMLVSGQTSNDGSDHDNVIIDVRNDRAMEVLNRSISMSDNAKQSNSRYALLYGAMHCKDLHRKLQAQGFVAKSKQWRTAWSVNVPSFGTGRSDGGFIGRRGASEANEEKSASMTTFAGSATPEAIALALLAVPLYMAVGGLDWIGMIRDVSASIELRNWGEVVIEIGLYLVRHAALYLGLAKFVVEWDGTNLFIEGDTAR